MKPSIYMIFTCSYEVEPEAVVFCCPDVGLGSQQQDGGWNRQQYLTWWAKSNYNYAIIDHAITHMLHVWYIYLQNWAIFGVNVGVHIPAPWSIWVIYTYIPTHTGPITLHVSPVVHVPLAKHCRSHRQAGLKERRPDVYSQMFGCHVFFVQRRVQGEQLSWKA